MAEKSERQSRPDPLADLFSNVQLTGLSKPKHRRSTLEPLQIDLPNEVAGHQDSEGQKNATGVKQPKSPPRYMGEPYESNASDIEIEELDSDDEDAAFKSEEPVRTTAETPVEETTAKEQASPKSEIDMQTKLQIAMLQQKMHRQRLALKQQQEQEKSQTGNAVSSKALSAPSEKTSTTTSRPVSDSLAKLNSKLKPNQEAPSAMDLFLAAAAESEQAKNKPVSAAPVSKPKAPSIETAPSQPIDASVPAKPLMGNRLMLQIEELIRNQLPLLTTFHVASALDSFDRPLMKAIWRSHRSKFLMNGQLEYAVSSLAVIDAFNQIDDGQIAEGQLVAAYVETTASDYLIWVDLPHQRLVAAFADAKSYFAT
jgi:hypothetical protein